MGGDQALWGPLSSTSFPRAARMNARRTNRRHRHETPSRGVVSATGTAEAVDERADRILAAARVEAERRNLPLATVLQELGFTLQGNGATQNAPALHSPPTRPYAAPPQGDWRAQTAGSATEAFPPSSASVAELLPQLPHALLRTSAVDAVRTLLKTAVAVGASDVHLEYVGDEGRVRFRIDGLCADVARVPTERFAEVLARVKVLADMDVTERRKPQDGHLRFQTGGRVFDMRLATVPTRAGEKIGIRIASTGGVRLQLDRLGMEADDLAVVHDLATRPFGMVLATGPVGSGKTTTLYSCLNAIDRTRFHVCSIEDPVEVEIDGVNQVEANYFLGFDFVAGLRALLRQDPDAILIGEVRDEETAKTAVRASMTGRLVFSTLHANTSTGAISSLRNFQIPPHMVASALQGVVAQRLVRRVCDHCRAPYALTDRDLEMFGDAVSSDFVAWQGQGCHHCHGTGYSGRSGVFEVFQLDETLRGMIQEEESERRIRAYARETGMVTLQERGLQQIASGETTVEEYRRVLNF